MSKVRITKKKKFKPYKSRFEYDIAQNLKRKKMKFDYEKVKVSYSLPVSNGVCQDCGSDSIDLVHTYLPDFTLANGITIEGKGLFVPRDQRKILAVLDGNNDLTRETFRLLFYQNRWTNKRHTERYGDWCDRHDIIWAVGPEVPDEWLD